MLTENLKELTRLNELVQVDGEKFITNGNKAAGTRVRLNLQKIKNLSHDLKKQISTIKNESQV